MTRLFARWIIVTFSIVVAGQFINGIHVTSLASAIIAAALLGVLNLIIRPLLILLTLPLTIVTFGLFLFIVNALMILIASHLTSGFYVDGLMPAFWTSLLISIVSFLTHAGDSRRSYRAA